MPQKRLIYIFIYFGGGWGRGEGELLNGLQLHSKLKVIIKKKSAVAFKIFIVPVNKLSV